MKRKLALKVKVLCAVLPLAAALACNGSGTATTAPPPVATDTPVAGVEVLDATFALDVDEDGEPVDPTDEFAPDQTIYLALTLKGRPEGTVTAHFYLGDELLGEAEVDLSDANAGVVFSVGRNTFVNFWMSADADDPSRISDAYTVEISYDDQLIGTYSFSVVPPSDAIPSQVREVTLARGVDSDYNPTTPTTVFVSEDKVYLVARGDIGLYTWLQAEWYVDGQLDEAGTRSMTAEENVSDMGFYFSYVPEGGWPLGEHQVVLVMNDEVVGRYNFTITEPAEAVLFEDPNGVFSLNYPPDFDQIETDTTAGYNYTFDAPGEGSVIYVYFDSLEGTISDDNWQRFAEDYSVAGMPGFGEDTVELDRQLGEPGVHVIYLEVESEETNVHGLVFVEEAEGALAVVALVVPIDEWPNRQAELSASLDSFTWSPQAVHDVLGR